ncbi:MAG: SoxR reducing system RseC family protein [Sterolibacterium sp.]|nr:SoxR reducing system RseC family protein [Sterolibacterium sp.]
MENRGTVTCVEGAYALVEVRPVSAGCGRCHETGGCGGGLLTEALRPKGMTRYRLKNTIGAQVGDEVVLRVAEGAVLRVALLAYLLPVICLIVGAAIATAIYAEDHMALAGAVSGLLLGLLVLRLLQSRLAHGSARIDMHFAGNDTLRMDCHG